MASTSGTVVGGTVGAGVVGGSVGGAVVATVASVVATVGGAVEAIVVVDAPAVVVRRCTPSQRHDDRHRDSGERQPGSDQRAHRSFELIGAS